MTVRLPSAGRCWNTAGWVEPILATLALAFALAVQPDQSVPALVLTLILCLGAGLAGSAPRLATALTAGGLLTFLVLPPAEVSVGGLAVFVNVFAAVRLGGRTAVLRVLLLGAACYATMAWHASSSLRDHLVSLTFLLALGSLAVGAGVAWRVAARRLARERATADERVMMLRTGLARDLHDTAAQALSHAAMRAHLLAADPALAPRAKEELTSIAEECSASAHELRALLSTLRQHDRPPCNLADAATLDACVNAQARRLAGHGFAVTAEVQVGAICEVGAATLTKVTLEATTNIIKHGVPGTPCRIAITEEDCEVLAVYSNKIAEAARVNPAGLGLLGIKERAALVGGSCVVTQSEGWWHVTVRLPGAPPHEGRTRGRSDLHSSSSSQLSETRSHASSSPRPRTQWTEAEAKAGARST